MIVATVNSQMVAAFLNHVKINVNFFGGVGLGGQTVSRRMTFGEWEATQKGFADTPSVLFANTLNYDEEILYLS